MQTKLVAALLLLFVTSSCKQKQKGNITHQISKHPDSSASKLPAAISYTEIKQLIDGSRKKLAASYAGSNQIGKEQILNEAKRFWVTSIGTGLYKYWAGTPWDFNGTTLVPKQGAIACGYFVNTLLQDMGVRLNRVKLSTCAASEMMHKLTPHQPIKKLNSLAYNQFCDYLKNEGKAVYVIGLDYHVGLLVNDGQNCWFIHSNYINKQDVIKELAQYSIALKASNTRWLINLTNDKEFIVRWLTLKT